MLGLFKNDINEYILKMTENEGYVISIEDKKYKEGDLIQLSPKNKLNQKVQLSEFTNRSIISKILIKSLNSKYENEIFEAFTDTVELIKVSVINDKVLKNKNKFYLKIDSLSKIKVYDSKNENHDSLCVDLIADGKNYKLFIDKKEFDILESIFLGEKDVY